MKIYLALLFAALAHAGPRPHAVTQLPGYTQLSPHQINHLQKRGFGSTIKTFRPTAAYREEEYEEYADSEPESTQDRAPTFVNQNYPVPVKTTVQPTQNYPIPLRPQITKAYVSPTQKPERRPVQGQPQFFKRGEDENKLEEEKEEEEPDRLSLLLPQSRFNCNGKHTGYYADEDLGCEVFHYCQDNAKHSWICPDGFTFHQVHLICMPPGGDNICEKSSDYHFVNDFLYKPLNLEEFQHKPNITLRYSDRYYPEAYRPKLDDDEDDGPNHRQHSVRVVTPQRLPHSPLTTLRPNGQVFRSPEEINISLQQRRPVQYTNDY